MLVPQFGNRIPAGGGGVIPPLDIPGLDFYFDFSDGAKVFSDTSASIPITDGGSIGNVANQGSFGGTGAQASGSTRPLWHDNVQNGLAVGRFDGAVHRLGLNPGALAATDHTFIFVINPVYGGGAGGTESMFDAIAGRLALYSYYSGTNGIGGYTGSYFSFNVMPETGWAIQAMTLSDAESKLYRNGGQVGDTVDTYEPVTIGGTTTLGSGSSGSNPMALDFGVWLHYSRILTAEELAGVTAWLNNKWSIY